MSAAGIDRLELESATAGNVASAQGFSRYCGVLTGVLIGLTDDDGSALVTFDGQPGTAAIRARTTIDLHGRHIGRHVVLMFEQADPLQPIVIGCVRGSGRQARDARALVEIETDGERVIVAAKEQLVLKCGKASITLTSSGKVLISGAYVLSHSTGTNRVKGGSVQLN